MPGISVEVAELTVFSVDAVVETSVLVVRISVVSDSIVVVIASLVVGSTVVDTSSVGQRFVLYTVSHESVHIIPQSQRPEIS